MRGAPWLGRGAPCYRRWGRLCFKYFYKFYFCAIAGLNPCTDTLAWDQVNIIPPYAILSQYIILIVSWYRGKQVLCQALRGVMSLPRWVIFPFSCHSVDCFSFLIKNSQRFQVTRLRLAKFLIFFPNYSPPDHNLGQILNSDPARSYFPLIFFGHCQ